MKKLGVGLFMMVIIIIYIVSIKNIGKDDSNNNNYASGNVTQNISARLSELEDSIEKEYPDTPKKVLELHNEFMAVAYSSQMSKEDVPSYVEKIRGLYSQELNDLNSKDTQQQSMMQELDDNSKESFIILSSQIGDVTVINNSNEGEMAEVMVKHSTNQGELIRMYKLIKENEQWKIYSWENEESETANLEE